MPSGPRVYLADPDPAFRLGVARALRDVGLDVVEFASPAQLEASALGEDAGLVLLANGREGTEGQQVLARLRSPIHARSSPLVLVTDRNQSFDSLAASVASLLEDWNRLAVHTVSSVVTWLQTRRKSGRFELEALGARGTVLLQDGEITAASWKELRDREVVSFFAEKFPNAGFRFAEPIPAPPLQANGAGVTLDGVGAHARLPPGPSVLRAAPASDRAPAGLAVLGSERFQAEAHLELARTFLGRGAWAEAFVHLRLAEGLAAPRERVQALLGVAHLRCGDLQAAVQELGEAVRVDPLDEVAVRALGEFVAALRALPGAETGTGAEPPTQRAWRESRGPDAREPAVPSGPPDSAPAPEAQAPAASPGTDGEPLVPLPAGPPILTRALRRAIAARSDSVAPSSRGAGLHAAESRGYAQRPAAPPAWEPRAATSARGMTQVRSTAGTDTAAPVILPLPSRRVHAPPAAAEAKGSTAAASIAQEQSPAIDQPGASLPQLSGPGTGASVRALRQWSRGGVATGAAAAAATVVIALLAVTSDRPTSGAPLEGTTVRSVERVGQRAAFAPAPRDEPRVPPSTVDPAAQAGAGEVGPPAAHTRDASGAPTMAQAQPPAVSTNSQGARSDDAARMARGDAPSPTIALESKGQPQGGVPAALEPARATSPTPDAGPTLEELRSGPRRVPLTRTPFPARVLDARSVRALIGGSRDVAIVRGWTGTVDPAGPSTLWVLVDAEGRVQDARILQSSGDIAFDEEALRTVRSLAYDPGRHGSQPVPAWVRQRVILRED